MSYKLRQCLSSLSSLSSSITLSLKKFKITVNFLLAVDNHSFYSIRTIPKNAILSTYVICLIN